MPPHLRTTIAWIAAVLAIALLALGLYQPNMNLWRLTLLLGIWLLSLLPRAYLSRRTPIVTRGLVRLTLVFGLAFAAVALQLTREQISQAEVIRTQALSLFTPPPANTETSTPSLPEERTTLGVDTVWPVQIEAPSRGWIVDRNNTVLAEVRHGRRVYPNPDMGHIVGFASRLYGVTGVEASYDGYLSGLRSIDPNDVLEAQLLGTEVNTFSGHLMLSIDTNLQRVAQEALGERKGAVVLLDPTTGAILALASYPRFDPNQLVLPDNATQADVDAVQAAWNSLTSNPDSPLVNRATQGRYPPGSVIKTLTAAAALDSGVLSPASVVTCPNRLATEAGAPPVRNAVENLNRFAGDPSDLRRVFAFSCNTAFAQIGLVLGVERFGEYAQRFGLGFAEVAVSPDLREIPAAAGSIANSPTFLERQVALADTAFGQGQALVTPLDMAQMAAVIANEGRLMRPYLVERVRVGDRMVYNAEPEVLRQVISPQAAAQMREVMRDSVQIGYASPVALPGVTIGAKTGTAEVPSGDPHAWFIAIAPVEQPRYAIAVIVENGGEGSRSALPVARTVLAAALEQ